MPAILFLGILASSIALLQYQVFLAPTALLSVARVPRFKRILRGKQVLNWSLNCLLPASESGEIGARCYIRHADLVSMKVVSSVGLCLSITITNLRKPWTLSYWPNGCLKRLPFSPHWPFTQGKSLD